MDILNMGIASVASITVICMLAAQVAKATSFNTKRLPALCGLLGLVLGVVAFVTGVPDFPAGDYLTAAAVGVVSGLAAVGTHQLYKQSTGEG